MNSVNQSRNCQVILSYYNYEMNLQFHQQTLQNHKYCKYEDELMKITFLLPNQKRYYNLVLQLWNTFQKPHQIIFSSLIIKSETNCPETIAGGTPGPGTVS